MIAAGNQKSSLSLTIVNQLLFGIYNFTSDNKTQELGGSQKAIMVALNVKVKDLQLRLQSLTQIVPPQSNIAEEHEVMPELVEIDFEKNRAVLGKGRR